MKTIVTDKMVVIIGLGKTGYSCVRHLVAKGCSVAVLDSNTNPILSEQLKAEFPQVKCQFGNLNADWINQASEIVISPGVPIKTKEIQDAIALNIPVVGDIDLFLREFTGRIIAITGSNGKSTVTTLVGEMARAQGINTGVGGNIGIPVLELLKENPELVVLELSSFQLETIHNLQHHIAIVLNVSEDHMDRYDSMEHYLRTKHLIFKNASVIVSDKNDALTVPLMAINQQQLFFSLVENLFNGFSAPATQDDDRAIYFGRDTWLKQSELLVKGNHNLSNALASLSIGQAAGFDKTSMISTLKKFPGLPHRCQWISTIENVDYINDSKATNVGAALAALIGLAKPTGKNIVLIAGGIGKDADFTPMISAVSKTCKSVIVLGKAAIQLRATFESVVKVLDADSMEDAVRLARLNSDAGDTVLLAPACSSFDMFNGFEDRGDAFVEAVGDLV